MTLPPAARQFLPDRFNQYGNLVFSRQAHLTIAAYAISAFLFTFSYACLVTYLVPSRSCLWLTRIPGCVGMSRWDARLNAIDAESATLVQTRYTTNQRAIRLPCSLHTAHHPYLRFATNPCCQACARFRHQRRKGILFAWSCP